MTARPIIFDFSGAYGEEGFRDALDAEGTAYEWIDLTRMEGTCCYCSEEASASLRSLVAHTELHALHWIDSGDYHYMTKFFAERIAVPYTLVLLDHHTDRQEAAFPELLSCGSWVQRLIAEDPHLRGVISIGPEEGPECIGTPDAAGPVYISLDKDILSADCARTDWSQGAYSLPEVLALLDRYVSNALGVDICGELPASKGGRPEDMAVNLQTNLAFLHFFQKKFTNFEA